MRRHAVGDLLRWLSAGNVRRDEYADRRQPSRRSTSAVTLVDDLIARAAELKGDLTFAQSSRFAGRLTRCCATPPITTAT
jgi:hypothetical protein